MVKKEPAEPDLLSGLLMELLVCPACKGDLVQQTASPPGLGCPACRLNFPIEDGIPVMLLDQAKPLT